MFNWRHERQAEIEACFRAFVSARDFPCVGAKSALARGTLKVVVCRALDSSWDDLRIHHELLEWAHAYGEEPGLFRSIAFLFEQPVHLDELAFERHLWARLQSIADKDSWLGQRYDERVSADPDDPHFCLSFGGEAFFVVGLHPQASRPARRFAHPTMVFNLHDQFEQLRAEGMYESIRRVVLDRDQALAGSVNPMLNRHGEGSAARQYSGRAVGSDWRCPFSDARAPATDEAP